MSKRDPLILLGGHHAGYSEDCRYTSEMDHEAFLRDELVIDVSPAIWK
jgi:hypothetical protein